MGELHKEYLKSRLYSEAFTARVADLVEMKTGPLRREIAELQEQAKPQPKPKPQRGTATLFKRIAELEDENKQLAAKLTKIASLKRARTMQHDRRVDLRNMDNGQKSAEIPAAKKRNTRNSRSSTTVDDN